MHILLRSDEDNEFEIHQYFLQKRCNLIPNNVRIHVDNDIYLDSLVDNTISDCNLDPQVTGIHPYATTHIIMIWHL